MVPYRVCLGQIPLHLLQIRIQIITYLTSQYIQVNFLWEVITTGPFDEWGRRFLDSDWFNNFFIDNDETIDNVYDRKEKISSGEKARILDSDHRDGNVVYIVR